MRNSLLCSGGKLHCGCFAKKFLPFTPDLVFTNKIHTPIDANATNPHVYFEEDGTTLDVESWLKELG